MALVKKLKTAGFRLKSWCDIFVSRLSKCYHFQSRVRFIRTLKSA